MADFDVSVSQIACFASLGAPEPPHETDRLTLPDLLPGVLEMTSTYCRRKPLVKRSYAEFP